MKKMVILLAAGYFKQPSISMLAEKKVLLKALLPKIYTVGPYPQCFFSCLTYEHLNIMIYTFL